MIHLRSIGACILLAGGASHGQAEFFPIGQGIAITDLSENGTVVVGNTTFDGAYETWRWVEGNPAGWQRLGLATVPVLGTGAGTPDVSYDGTRVSATILGPIPESRGAAPPYATQGIWTDGQGWAELMPPLAPDSTVIDNSHGSAWGLSGDGTTVSGFYWNDSPFFGSARPCYSTIGGGPVGLSAPMGSSGRVNAVNFDATVGVGWTEDQGGQWLATVWRDGAYSWIAPDLGWQNNALTEAFEVNADGSVIVGEWYEVATARTNAARWDWNGSGYDLTDLGVLPGTPQTSVGRSFATGVSDDGEIVVGMNRFNNNGPFSLQTGFVWTSESGLRDIADVLADYGFSFPVGYIINYLNISPDGRTIGILVLDSNTTGIFDYWSYLFRFPTPQACDGDLSGDGATNVLDFSIFTAYFGTSGHAPFTNGDLDGDGDVDVLDFGLFLNAFGCTTLGD